MLEFESILDAPRDGLDQSVWFKDEDGTFQLTDLARKNIGTIVEWASGMFHLQGSSANVTGSITSNQYGDGSDIDVHIFHPSFREMDEDSILELNKVLRKNFE